VLCFRPVKAVKKVEPSLVFEKLEAVADSVKQFRVEVKNSGGVAGNLLGVVMVRESSEFSDGEVAVVWGKSVIAPGEVVSGAVSFDWVSGKTYYVKAQTNENTSVSQYVKTP
jgi:hypothetical protein